MMPEIKIELEDLKQGMYVSRLDRPWIETSFLLEGLSVDSVDDIEALKKVCKYVYVDTDRGDSPREHHAVKNKKDGSDRQNIKPAGKRRKTSTQPENVENPELSGANSYPEKLSAQCNKTYRAKTTFSEEIKTASILHEKIENNYEQILSDLRSGRDLNMDILADGISDMTNSIIRNPSAMIWVAHIKQLDEYSYSRALGTSVWCATFGRHLGLDQSAIETLSLGGLLLDIGKSMLPGEFLKLSRELTPAERRVMQKHVKFGMKILSKANWGNIEQFRLNDIMKMVADHHERADASGYPDGLTDKEISFFGRMAGIVDSFDAMTTERPNITVNSRSVNNAVNELYNLRGNKFQAELVEQFIQTVGVYPAGSLVELNTGEVGVVVGVNSLHRLRPTIMLLLDENKKSLDALREIDLAKSRSDLIISRNLAQGAFDINLADLFL